MRVLADTPVWSEAFRRSNGAGGTLRRELGWLIEHGAVAIIGPVRQELLSGIKVTEQFERVRKALRAFPDIPLRAEDHENAAHYFKVCRSRGVQGLMTDFPICAVAVRSGLEIHTTDGDFPLYRKHLPIALYAEAKA